MVISNKVSTATAKWQTESHGATANRGPQAMKLTHASQSSKEEEVVEEDMVVKVDQEGIEGIKAHEQTQNPQYDKKGKEAEVGKEPQQRQLQILVTMTNKKDNTFGIQS